MTANATVTQEKVKALPILTYPHPVLSKVAEPIHGNEFQSTYNSVKSESYDVVEQLQRAIEAITWGRCSGLAAPQIGISKRIFIALNQVFVNPVITGHSKEERTMLEGCYSMKPNKFDYRVKRYRWIVLEWQDIFATIYRRRFSRFDAQVIQHEMDHLNGKGCLTE